MKKIKKKIQEFFTTNILLKVCSFVLAFLCWSAIANAANQVKTLVVRVPIEYKFEDALEEDYGLAVLKATEYIEIDVKARRSDVDRVSADDFKAVADLTQNIGGGEDFPSERLVRVEVSYSDDADHSAYIEWDYQKTGPYVKVNMDKYIEKQFEVKKQITADEGLPQEYVLSDDQIELNPSVITISGPESEFSDVAAVKVVETLEMTADEQVVKKTVNLEMYDNTDSKIDRESKPLLKMSSETAELTATFLNVGTPTVKLESINGTPAEGYKVSSFSVEPSTVTIAGIRSVVSETNEIIIPKDVLSVDGQKEDVSVEVDLNDYLPDGVELLGESSKAVVTVKIEQLKDKLITYNTSNLDVVGKNENYDYSFNPFSVNIRFNGFEADLEKLSEKSIHASVDVSNLEPGTHQVPVVVEDIVGYTIKNQESLSVRVTVTEKKNNTEKETDSSVDSSQNDDNNGTITETTTDGEESPQETETIPASVTESQNDDSVSDKETDENS